MDPELLDILSDLAKVAQPIRLQREERKSVLPTKSKTQNFEKEFDLLIDSVLNGPRSNQLVFEEILLRPKLQTFSKDMDEIIDEFNAELFQEMSKIPPHPKIEPTLHLNQLAESTTIQQDGNTTLLLTTESPGDTSLDDSELDYGWVTSDVFLRHTIQANKVQEGKEAGQEDSDFEQEEVCTQFVNPIDPESDLQIKGEPSEGDSGTGTTKHAQWSKPEVCRPIRGQHRHDNDIRFLEHKESSSKSNILLESGEWNLNTFHQPLDSDDDGDDSDESF